jgi:regulator of replication initiation timing
LRLTLQEIGDLGLNHRLKLKNSKITCCKNNSVLMEINNKPVQNIQEINELLAILKEEDFHTCVFSYFPSQTKIKGMYSSPAVNNY